MGGEASYILKLVTVTRENGPPIQVPGNELFVARVTSVESYELIQMVMTYPLSIALGDSAAGSPVVDLWLSSVPPHTCRDSRLQSKDAGWLHETLVSRNM